MSGTRRPRFVSTLMDDYHPQTHGRDVLFRVFKTIRKTGPHCTVRASILGLIFFTIKKNILNVHTFLRENSFLLILNIAFLNYWGKIMADKHN